jgi:hypothetical protein
MEARMKAVLLIVALLLPATVAVGQNALEISTDPQAWFCDLVDDAEGIREIYILHLGSEAVGVRFKLEATEGMTMTYLSEEYFQPVLSGNTQTGIEFCYGDCKGLGPLVLAKVIYMGHGTSGCSKIQVVPYPGSGAIDELVCGGGVLYADGGQLLVNFDGCGGPCWNNTHFGLAQNPYDYCAPVSTEYSTWGAIKSLYK